MTSPRIEPLHYDWSGAAIAGRGVSRQDFEQLSPRLAGARAEVLADAQLWKDGGKVPPEKEPLDAGFIELPERLLAEYRASRATSQLERILTCARRLDALVDRVVVLGIGGSYMGARALFESCCHPYYNEQPRSERGGHPRIYFEGNNVDNDAMQGLLDLLGVRACGVCRTDLHIVEGELPQRRPKLILGHQIVGDVVGGATLETAVAFRQLLAVLRKSCGSEKPAVADLVIPITGASGRLFELARALGCQETFPIPDGVGGRFSILSAVGLVPAAVLGLDIIALLEGAAAMNAHFQSAPPAENVVLQYVGVCHLMEQQHGATIRVLSTWGKGLEAAGLWYDQLLAESLGKHERGATPLTVVNTRDLHSRGQQHQEGRRDKLITNVIVDQVRRDRLAVGSSDFDQDQLNSLAGKTMPEIMAAAIAGTNQAYADDQRPTTDLHLPRLNEASLGQFFQMMMLATAVEGRLIGINPYGQPGVEAYKKHMNANLRK